MPPIADRFVHPTRTRYKQRDSIIKDTIVKGDYKRTNWVLAYYLLLGEIPSIHEGDDIVGEGFNCYGDDVLSISNGTVIFSALVPRSTWGNMVIVEYTLLNGFKIYGRYAHLKDRLVQAGDEVSVEQIIGHIGGREWGMIDHLHSAICVTDLLVREPTNWPSGGGRTEKQARAMILENYLDPLFYIDSRIAMDPLPEPPEEVPDVTNKDMYVNTPDSVLRFREQPNSTAEVISRLVHRTKVTAFDLIENNYQLIKVRGVYGFVSSPYLSPTPPV